jgi:light-regulated signal transduction histidine kinase (bacteriophytochrome)
MQYPRTSFQVDRPGLANCDATMVRQIMGNLIGNACKYSAMREAPLVEVGWRMRAQTREYFVRDNGMGFDMAHASHLYEVFHRLHADSKIPGNGVGLAIVKRLIDRHNGHIEAESSVGAGACFRFTLDQDPAYSKMPDRS